MGVVYGWSNSKFMAKRYFWESVMQHVLRLILSRIWWQKWSFAATVLSEIIYVRTKKAVKWSREQRNVGAFQAITPLQPN